MTRTIRLDQAEESLRDPDPDPATRVAEAADE